MHFYHYSSCLLASALEPLLAKICHTLLETETSRHGTYWHFPLTWHTLLGTGWPLWPWRHMTIHRADLPTFTIWDWSLEWVTTGTQSRNMLGMYPRLHNYTHNYICTLSLTWNLAPAYHVPPCTTPLAPAHRLHSYHIHCCCCRSHPAL